MRKSFDSYIKLAELIGEDAALKLVKEAGGGTIYIPKSDTVFRKQRNERIRKDYHNGMTYKQLHIKYNLTERQIRIITAQ